jgi:hypothetical protein
VPSLLEQITGGARQKRERRFLSKPVLPFLPEGERQLRLIEWGLFAPRSMGG